MQTKSLLNITGITLINTIAIILAIEKMIKIAIIFLDLPAQPKPLSTEVDKTRRAFSSCAFAVTTCCSFSWLSLPDCAFNC